MVEIFHSENYIPFHHLPPVPWEPIEFLSCTFGSVKAQALQREVDKMLEKGTPEEVEDPGWNYYSRLFQYRRHQGDEVQ